MDSRKKEFVELIRLLLEEGAITDVPHPPGLTLLQTLVQEKNLFAMKALLQHGASINFSDTKGRSALHYSVSESSLDAVKLLLKFGAAPNLRDNQQNTPLHLARSLAIAVCLVMHGSRVDLINIIKTRAAQYFETFANEEEKSDALKSIDEAAQHWQSLSDTYTDGQYADDSIMMHDAISDTCLLCSQPFSFIVRRHHCKRCGILCCYSCSTKCFAPRTKLNERHRACDGCYNLLYDKQQHEERILRKQRLRQARISQEAQQLQSDREVQRREYERIRQAQEERIARKREELLARGDTVEASKYAASSSTSDQQHPKKMSLADKAKSMSSMMSTMGNNKNLALERGEKLDELEDKSTQLEDDASNFASLARKLREKQQKSIFGIF
jgi:hypothetical protein